MARTYHDALKEMLDESRSNDIMTLFEKVIYACASDARTLPSAEARMDVVVEAIRPFVDRLRGQYGADI
jgi:hypothetical protein